MEDEQARTAGTLCREDEVGEGQARGLLRRHGEDTMFAVRRHGVLRVYVNSCPHNRRPLEYAQDKFLSADGSHIVCYAHGAHFDIASGLCTHGPCAGLSLQAVPFRVQDGNVVLETGT